MKLAVSQIAWQPQEEERAVRLLRGAGFSGLEIAPSLAVGPKPYERPARAAAYAKRMEEDYGLSVCSMQSIWYGMTGSIFGPERQTLLEYTREAIRFAAAARCGNLVFGCPKNRVLPQGESDESAVSFFRQLGDFALRHGTVLSLEANPPIYGANFITRTAETFERARRVCSPGFMVNLDFGALVLNGEEVEALAGRVADIRHVHISEPNLAPVRPHARHGALARLLRREGYDGYISIEMRAAGLKVLEQAIGYVAEVFG
jgi:sugar phosphate isomerase/epimerase